MRVNTTKKGATELSKEKRVLADLQRIPSIGPKVAKMLFEIGIDSVSSLRDRSPEELYEKVCLFRHENMDRCVLYHFRCAVYFATEKEHDPERLKWWSWKDG